MSISLAVGPLHSIKERQQFCLFSRHLIESELGVAPLLRAAFLSGSSTIRLRLSRQVTVNGHFYGFGSWGELVGQHTACGGFRDVWDPVALETLLRKTRRGGIIAVMFPEGTRQQYKTKLQILKYLGCITFSQFTTQPLAKLYPHNSNRQKPLPVRHTSTKCRNKFNYIQTSTSLNHSLIATGYLHLFYMIVRLPVQTRSNGGKKKGNCSCHVPYSRAEETDRANDRITAMNDPPVWDIRRRSEGRLIWDVECRHETTLEKTIAYAAPADLQAARGEWSGCCDQDMKTMTCSAVLSKGYIYVFEPQQVLYQLPSLSVPSSRSCDVDINSPNIRFPNFGAMRPDEEVVGILRAFPCLIPCFYPRMPY
ncbi:uncharacterized protein BDR25DRAFT_356881 [Lindgomyces ingoldianus]|uniref:Uncharacterized protein n=1 Tax=Lindgomyces ingoldianus TaxID=673940 RepID=A0ACB6QQA0_9PLEO|nr:uncharacterized protein BDR25DRAFT_356881 [Lindgomyces ingoldianus]KAF2469096.1 hypothetical protein BDR25DRAFT_356881 [Lindgomyces ingoldianus]